MFKTCFLYVLIGMAMIQKNGFKPILDYHKLMFEDTDLRVKNGHMVIPSVIILYAPNSIYAVFLGLLRGSLLSNSFNPVSSLSGPER